MPKHSRPGGYSNAGNSGGGGIGGGAGGAAPHHPCKINKRAYATHNLIGLPYGTVLEVSTKDSTLIPLPEGEDLLPKSDIFLMKNGNDDDDDDNMNNNSNDDNNLLEDYEEEVVIREVDDTNDDDDAKVGTTTTTTTTSKHNDNRNLIDDNTSQRLTHNCVDILKSSTSTSGSDIVAALISNSATFHTKTKYSQAKYVTRKQLKYQIRCRIVQINPYTLCAAMHTKDARKMANLRDDTLGRIVSTANVHAGQYVLVADDAVQGIITSSCVSRMGGYGSVMGLYPGKFVPGYVDVTAGRMNYTLRERQMLRWISLGEVFGKSTNTDNSIGGDSSNNNNNANPTVNSNRDAAAVVDIEKRDRERISWPAPLMPHTRQYITNELQTPTKINVFLEKRSARFARKLTRYSALELRELIGSFCNEKERYNSTTTSMMERESNVPNVVGEVESVDMAKETSSTKHVDDTTTSTIRQCDSLIIATKYDPTQTLFGLLPYLAPSCPFVVYCEFLEPLLHTFHALQNYYVEDEVGGNSINSNDAVDTTDIMSNEDIDTDVNNMSSSSGGGGGSSSKGGGMSAKKPTRPPPMMQRRNIAINLRLTDSWFREYQVLEGRTHPNMSMSQNGGYVLAGTKLCPLTGTNELDDNVMKDIRAKLGGRRRQANAKRGGGLRAAKKRKKVDNDGSSGGGEEEGERRTKK